jgi:hypothetical protein
MGIEPFDTRAGRKTILRALNEIEGVALGSNEVYRWPRFPIAVLADTSSLAKFVGILDRLATETRPDLRPIAA